MLTMREIWRIKRYRRKLRRFTDSIWALRRRAPNKEIESKLLNVIIDCYKVIDGLAIEKTLAEQSEAEDGN